MSRWHSVLSALAAIVAGLALVVGVPVLLVTLVGNPWPGRARLEMGDELAVVVGVLAVIAWCVWARFVVAVVIELRRQVAELRAFDRTDQRFAVVPPRARGGIGLVAQRLVAAALLLLPVSAKAVMAIAQPPVLQLPERNTAQPVAFAAPAPVTPPAQAQVGAPEVTVGPGDTLIGLARAHLGEADRWREIFEINRDRLQPDGHRLGSPSSLRPGWRLTLPAATVVEQAPAPYLAPATVIIEAGDNLWDLSEERLVAAGLPADDVAVAEHLRVVIAENADIVEDPNLIYVGEQFDFPAVGSPPPPEPEPSPPPVTEAVPQANGGASIVELPVEVAAPAAVTAPTTTEVPATTATASATTSTTTEPAVAPPEDPAEAAAEDDPAPAPIGIGEAALLSAGVMALVLARRRLRLRSSQPRARVPEPPPDTVAIERRLRSVDAGERLLRVDVGLRAAAASLADGPARIAVVRVGADGTVELTMTGPAVLPAPWKGSFEHWVLPGATPIELLAEAARSVGAPCVALTQLGVDADGRELLVDLEALGLLSVDAPAEQADAVLRGIAATLGTSIFAEVANLIGVGVDSEAFLDHPHGHHVESVDEALELATTLVGTTVSAKQSTFVLRARHTSGEAWEPAIVLAGSSVHDQVTPDVVAAASRQRGGLAVITAGNALGAPWCLRAGSGSWTLEPLGAVLVPVGLTNSELHGVHDVLVRADEPLVDAETTVPAEPPSRNGDHAADGPFEDPPWSLLVRLLGPVEVIDREQRPARFERSKTLELIAWLTLHRDRSTRAGARTALWDLDVRDATFANVVSEARRAMARHVEPPVGEEWLGRTLTEILPLHGEVIADVDLVRARLEHARLQPPARAIDTLRPAVELIRDLPFAGTGYLWPDAEGITSNLVLAATGAASELAAHCLSMGDVDGVFWATGQGLKVLPGHEELISLRMRAHHCAGDLSGVRMEWESYERVLNADPWSDGEPAPKLVLLRRQLLSS